MIPGSGRAPGEGPSNPLQQTPGDDEGQRSCVLQSMGLKELDATEWPPSTTQTAAFPMKVDFVCRNVRVAAKSLDFHVSL